MHYFRRYWDESRGDKYDSWGKSDWWFETDTDGYVTRCVQKYENGNNLFYSNQHMEDKYGFLPEGKLELNEMSEYSITPNEFEDVCSNSTFSNIEFGK